MDPCECIWNHEMAMQRLMNLVSEWLSYYSYVVACVSLKLNLSSAMYFSSFMFDFSSFMFDC